MSGIVTKEWRRLTRSGGAPWALLVFVLVPVVVSAMTLKPYAQGQGVMPHMAPLIGAYALNMIGAWQLLFLALFAPWLAATSLAAEWEGNAIGLYRAAGGRLISLVLGKLTAIVGYLSLLVLAGLPAFVVPLLAGGVTWALIGRVVGLELAAAVAFAGLGLLIGATARQVGGVAVAGLTTGLVLTLGTGILVGMTGAGSATAHIDAMVWAKPMPMPMPGFPTQGGSYQLPVWLWSTNPIVGVNNAVNQQLQSALFGLPGAGVAPAFKEVAIWQAQIMLAIPVALAGAVLSWLLLSIRLSWKGFRWPARRRKQEVSAHVGAD